MQIGLMLIHLVIGALLAGHGAQKLFGWFGGPGIDGATGFMESLGLRPARPLAVAAGGSEFVGGILLALGLLTPLAALLIASTMLVAARTAHAGQGVWAQSGGWELPLINATVALGLAFSGPGAWSLDAALGLDLAGLTWGLGATILALVGGLGVLTVLRHRPDTTRTTAPAAG